MGHNNLKYKFERAGTMLRRKPIFLLLGIKHKYCVYHVEVKQTQYINCVGIKPMLHFYRILQPMWWRSSRSSPELHGWATTIQPGGLLGLSYLALDDCPIPGRTPHWPGWQTWCGRSITLHLHMHFYIRYALLIVTEILTGKWS